MTSRTNALTSHYPEHVSYPADKPLPRSARPRRTRTGQARKLAKRIHNRRARRQRTSDSN